MESENGSYRAQTPLRLGTRLQLCQLRSDAIAEVRAQLAQGRLWTTDQAELELLVDVIVAVEVLTLDGHNR